MTEELKFLKGKKVRPHNQRDVAALLEEYTDHQNKEIERLKVAFKKWARHKYNCEVNYEASGDCNCGWYDVIK